jgi:hypothetical protein
MCAGICTVLGQWGRSRHRHREKAAKRDGNEGTSTYHDAWQGNCSPLGVSCDKSHF